MGLNGSMKVGGCKQYGGRYGHNISGRPWCAVFVATLVIAAVGAAADERRPAPVDESAAADNQASKESERTAPAVKPVPAKLSDLHWLAGRWKGSMGSQSLEESWSGIEGDCMMGMFRWLRDGKVWLYEFLTIREEGDSLVLRFRHFGPALGCWEEKETPLTLNLTKTGGGYARFTLIGDKPWHYTYRLSPDKGEVMVTVGEAVDGSEKGTTLLLKRVNPEG